MKKQFIKEVVLKLEGLINEVGEFNYNKNFTPTDAVAQKARQALSQISAGNLTTSGTNEGSGRQKAQELAEKKSQSVDQLKKMANFFSKNAAAVVRIKQSGAHTDEDKGIMQSWDLHGGEAGNQWVKNELKKFHDENLRTKSNLRKAGGAGTNKGMGIFDTSIMKTNKQRIHR